MPFKNRDLRALIALIFVMPFVLGGMIYVMACVVIFLFGGWGDVLKFINDWSWSPSYEKEITYKISSITAIGVAGFMTLLLWKILFKKKKDDFRILKHDVNLHRPRQSISATGYFFLFFLAIYFSFDAWSRGGLGWVIIFIGVAVFFLINFFRKFKKK